MDFWLLVCTDHAGEVRKNVAVPTANWPYCDLVWTPELTVPHLNCQGCEFNLAYTSSLTCVCLFSLSFHCVLLSCSPFTVVPIDLPLFPAILQLSASSLQLPFWISSLVPSFLPFFLTSGFPSFSFCYKHLQSLSALSVHTVSFFSWRTALSFPFRKWAFLAFMR